jgi:glycosyltransferase Alg8
MFTSLMGPIAALWGAYWITPAYLVAYAIIVILGRLIYSLILVIEGHRMSYSDIPMLLYTQWVGSMVKIYTMFHLHKQKWDSHRQAGNSSSGSAAGAGIEGLIPKMQVALSALMLVLFVTSMVGVK